MILLPDGRRAGFITESDAPEPSELTLVDDETRADVALRLLRAGKALLWVGDYRNGRNLLGALKRRLKRPSQAPASMDLSTRWRQLRAATRATAEVLSGVLVVVEPNGELELRRAPETGVAVELAWGCADGPRIVALNTLVGALGAAEWARKGMEVPGLSGRLVPRYGVFTPTRHAYVDLVAHLDVEGKSVLDVGCGTGVLGFALLQRGARSAVGTDLDPRAVECASHNAELLGLDDRFDAVEADLFPEGERADCVVFNAPWIPEAPRTRLDRTVFDEDGATLRRFVTEVPNHLSEDGVAALILSDLPERLGLRAAGGVERMAAEVGMQVLSTTDTAAAHGRSRDSSDPLHEARAAERIKMLVLGRGAVPRSGSKGRS